MGTLCSSLNRRWFCRIGGGHPLKGLLDESSDNVNICDVYSMKQIMLPSMTTKRAKCGATILPSTIPFHCNQQSNEEQQIDSNTNYPKIGDLMKQHFESPNTAPLPSSINEKMKTAPISKDSINWRLDYQTKALNEYPPFCLFVSGGLNENKLHKKCEIFYCFDAIWNGMASMKQARCGHICEYMGSAQWKLSLNENGDGTLTSNQHMFEWKDISDLTTKVFVSGGKQRNIGITSSECYDIETNEWSMTQRAPFSNHGSQSGCWWSAKQCVAITSDPTSN